MPGQHAHLWLALSTAGVALGLLWIFQKEKRRRVKGFSKEDDVHVRGDRGERSKADEAVGGDASDDGSEVEGDAAIEDLGAGQEEHGEQDARRRATGNSVSIRRRRREARTLTAECTARVWLRTFGCGHNMSDGEVMKGVLLREGYTIIDDERPEDADVWIVNSCTVKGPSEASARKLVRQAQEAGKHVILTGCVPSGQKDVKGIDKSVSLVGVNQIARIGEVVEETVKGHTVRLTGGGSELPALDLPKIRRNDVIEIIPINQGCLGSCTFCKTKHARGKLQSYPPRAIFERLRTAAQEGVSEIHITSEDTGAYGLDLGTSIAELLPAMVEELARYPDVMMRMGMTNPPYIMEHIGAIARYLNSPNVFTWIHIPVQSGSDNVLLKMRREYQVHQFRYLVEQLREQSPGCSIATDIIVGFPTESESDFEETLTLIKDLQLNFVHISPFYARPGTPAAALRPHPPRVLKERMARLKAAFESYTLNGPEIVGQTQMAWFSEVDVQRQQTVGHTKKYIKVVVDGLRKDLIGRRRLVRVTGVDKWHLAAELCETS